MRRCVLNANTNIYQPGLLARDPYVMLVHAQMKIEKRMKEDQSDYVVKSESNLLFCQEFIYSACWGVFAIASYFNVHPITYPNNYTT